MRAAINILLVLIVGLSVSARGLQSNLDKDSYTYDPDSIAQNERILRLFIQLASETANHLIYLKKVIKPPVDVRPNDASGAVTVSSNGSRDTGNRSESIKDSATQAVEIGTRMMTDAGKNDTSQVPVRTNDSGTTILPSQQSEPGLAPQDAGTARKVDVVVASTGESRLASQSGQSESKNQSRQSGNETGRMVHSDIAPGPGINQVPAGQLSSLSTAQPVGSEIQSGSKSPTGSGTGEIVHEARRPEFNQGPPGSLPSLSTVQAVESKIQSKIDSGRDFGGGVGVTRQLSTAGPRIDQVPLGQLSSLPIAQDAGSKNLTNGMIASMVGNPTEKSGIVNIGQLDPSRLLTFGSSLGSLSIPVNSELKRLLGPAGVPMNPGLALASIFNPTSVAVNPSGDPGRILGPVGVPMNLASGLGSNLNPISVPVNPSGDLGRILGPVGVPMNPASGLGPNLNPISVPMNPASGFGSNLNPISVPVNPSGDLGRILGPVGVPMNPASGLGPNLNPISVPMNPASGFGSNLNPISVPVNPSGDLGQIFRPVGVPMNPGAALGSIPNPMNVPFNPITDLGRILGPVGIPTVPVSVPMNPGASATSNQAVSAIVDAGNGTPVGLTQSGQDSGPKVLGHVHDRASSLTRGSTGQAGQLLSGLSDAAAKSTRQSISEKGNGILSSSPMGPNDGGISDPNSNLKEASPLFRSLPEVEATSGIEHDLKLTKEHGQTVPKAPIKSEERPSLLKDKMDDNAAVNWVSELELQDFAIKFADALRPLDLGLKIPGSLGSKDPMSNWTNPPKTLV